MSENEKSKSAYNYGRDSGYTDGFVDGYKAGVKAAKQKWIPTSERPPEKNGLYFVTYTNGVADIDTAFFQNGNWYNCTEDGIQDEYWHKVIAWMELPKPYEEGQK